MSLDRWNMFSLFSAFWTGCSLSLLDWVKILDNVLQWSKQMKEKSMFENFNLLNWSLDMEQPITALKLILFQNIEHSPKPCMTSLQFK